MTTTTVFEDWHVTLTPHEGYTDFRVVGVTTWDVLPGGGAAGPCRFGFAAGEDHPDPARAPPLVEGKVGADGCSNWAFDPQRRGDVHRCGPDGALGLGRLLAEVYRLAASMLPAPPP